MLLLNKMKRRTLILFILILAARHAGAQFDIPRLSQYLINGMVINPAYAGSREALSLTAVDKEYLTGFAGHPRTMKFAVHTPLKNEHVALGFSIENNYNPLVNNTGIYGNYAYRIWLGGVRLSFGLKAGIYHYNEDFSGDFHLYDNMETDPSFISKSGFAPNFGAGVYMYNNKFFTGLSIPYFLDFPGEGKSFNFNTGSYHYILTAGYLFDVSENLKLKPSTLVDYSTANLDVQAGLNFIMFQDRVWAGAMYRTMAHAFTGIIEFQVFSSFRIGYAYDYYFTNLSKVSNGTHEIMLRFELKFRKKAVSPFYF